MKSANKNLNRLIAGVLALAAAPQAAHAANWLMLQGTEPAGVSAPVSLWGFIQPTYFSVDSKNLSGLVGPNAAFNGQTPNFNRVGPQLESSNSFNILRARIGIRGVASPIDERINYFFLTEFGNNGYSRSDDGSSPRIIDGSITFNHIPGARVRVGLFKAPGMPEEGLQGIQVFDYINFTNVTQQLIQEQFFTTGPSAAAAPLAGSTTTGFVGTQQGTINAFRDTGIQVFDSFRRGPWDLGYAAMVGNGSPLFRTDNNEGKDLYYRLQGYYVFGNSKGPRRDDIGAWLWRQDGKRTFNGNDFDMVRQGIGVGYHKGFMQPNGMRFTAEYMQGKGMISAGSPFPGVGTTVYPGDDNKADGWYAEGGYFLTRNIEFDLRYDKYNRLTNSAADERDFTTWTLGAQYHFSPKARATINYEFRDLKVPNPGAITTPVARNNANAVADAMGDRLSVQATLIF